MTRFVLFLLLCCFFSLFGFGQGSRYAVTWFQSNEGLNAPTVYDVKQDHRGFLWIGTNNGLYRFDGENFRPYGVQDGLTDLDIFMVSVDEEDFVLVHNFRNTHDVICNGEVVRNRVHDSMNLSNSHSLGSYLGGYEFASAEKGTNFVQVVTYNKCQVARVKTVRFAKNAKIQALKSHQNCTVAICSEGIKTVYYVINNCKVVTKDVVPTGFQFVSLQSDGDVGGYWFYDFFSKELSRFVLSESLSLEKDYSIKTDKSVKNVVELGREEIWATLVAGGMVRLKGEETSQVLLPEYSINTVFKDRDENIWAGTGRDGLVKLEDHGVVNYGLKELEISDQVTTIEEGDSGSIYLGFDKLGICEFGTGIKQKWTLHTNSKLINRRVLDIERLGNGAIWCATDEGLFTMNSDSGHFLYTPVTACGKTISRLGDSVFMSTCGSVEVYDLETNMVGRIWDSRAITTKLDENKQNLLIGTTRGLYSKSLTDDSVVEFKLLSNRKIQDIAIAQNKLVLATDSGLCILYRDSSVTYITSNEGLTGNSCSKVVLDANSLWLATFSGLSWIQFNDSWDQYSITGITRYSGLSSNNVNDVLVNGDTVWVATNKGLSLVRKSAIKTNKKLTINIIGLSSGGQEHNPSGQLELKPGSKDFQISFAALAFGHQLKYMYQLNPVSDTWNYTANTMVNYRGLTPGKYVFKVRAVDVLGNMSAPGNLHVVIKPYFYETSWFQWSSSILVLIIVLSSFYWYNVQAREKALKKDELNRRMSALELEAIKAQINPHFIHNALSSIQYTIMENKKDEAEKQLGMFSQLIRDTLDFSKLDFISITNEIEYLERYLTMQQLRFKDQLVYSISTSLESVSRHSIPSMLLQPLVENAIKHGMRDSVEGKSRIEVRFVENETEIICEIEDNGKGIDNKAIGTKFVPSGTDITSTRIGTYNALYNLDVTIEYRNKEETMPDTQGTIVSVTIPKHNKVNAR
ncbi:MAG: histidine kinase [Bacteroidia bacterium]|nr:histidine kinase [Bacteroidia bacterium]